MYIIHDGPYATAATSKREGTSTYISTEYLGKIIDEDQGIFWSRARGYFKFDIETGEYSAVPDEIRAKYEPQHDETHLDIKSTIFGGVYVLNDFLYKSGLMSVIDTLPCKNKDTLHSLILFYALSDLANCDAIKWSTDTVTHFLYPNANLESQRVSEFLEDLGNDDVIYNFQKQYIDFVFTHYDPDRNILVDSSGLPNDIHFDLTRLSNHRGKVSNEVRLALVFQSKTGLPLFYMAVPGNVVDVSTLGRIFAHLDALGVKVDTCIMDAGYNSAMNLDLFYADDNTCRCDYITRTKSNSKLLTEMISEVLPTLISTDNYVVYEDRHFYIVKKPIKVGVNEDKPAYLFLGFDCAEYGNDILDMCKKARKAPLTADEVTKIMTNSGFVGFISSHDYSCEEILPQYYKREFAEQTFDLMKNYTKLLPLRVKKVETFKGHLLIAYIAAIALRMAQIKMREVGGFLGSKLQILQLKTAVVYSDRIITDWSDADINEVCTALDTKYPCMIRINDGRLQYIPPKPDAPKAPKRSRKSSNTKAKQKTEKSADAPKRGRPKGSRNKKTLEREAQMQALGITQTKRGRGRPKGSRNKKTIEREQALAAGDKAIPPA